MDGHVVLFKTVGELLRPQSLSLVLIVRYEHMVPLPLCHSCFGKFSFIRLKPAGLHLKLTYKSFEWIQRVPKMPSDRLRRLNRAFCQFDLSLGLGW